jgi:metal-responsive CopG/Arc/MetJ family transcriptional regulator
MGLENQRITPAIRYRQAKAAEGRSQVNIWVEADLKQQLDTVVKTGIYRNRSEVIAAAVQRFLEENK